MRDDEHAYRYYDDLTETKNRAREVREGIKPSQAPPNRYETMPNDSSADITTTNTEDHLQQRLRSDKHHSNPFESWCQAAVLRGGGADHRLFDTPSTCRSCDADDLWLAVFS